MVAMDKDKVRVIHMEGAGCYGHNGADDAAADAALIARALPGRPVRVQWMREQEHGWEPYGSAMITHAKASLDAGGRIVDWNYEVWSNTHAMRPGSAGNLLAGQLIANAFTPDAPANIPQPSGGGDRNAVPLYKFPNSHVTKHFIPEMPIRVSSHRSLGAYMNVFSLESFMDELALAADADPVAFRLAHMEDQRARDVITLAAEKFGWNDKSPLPRGHGRGFAFAQYKNLASYCAVAMEVAVDDGTGDILPIRAVAACDSGQVVNPDGIRNQIEGAIVQSLSWTLYEQVAFDPERITSRDWSSYPILRFNAVPEIDVHIINRPGMKFLGAGEAGQGPAAAALANAVANATGRRLRDIPFRRESVLAAARSTPV
jgi:CO/xanthine dehydrogenase Mo-binding subunit